MDNHAQTKPFVADLALQVLLALGIGLAVSFVLAGMVLLVAAPA